MLRTSVLWVWLPLAVLLAASCSSEGGSAEDGGQAGNGGEPSGNAGESGAAASNQGASSSMGGAGAGSDGGGAPAHAGAPTSGSGGAQAGASPAPGGAGGVGGANEASGGAPLVGEATCLQHEDCLPACQANGWPQAHCFGGSERFCSCESSSGGPTCTKGTTEGCPTGSACRGPQQCIPYGDATHGDPCYNGD